MSNKNHTVLFEKFEILETLKKDEFSAVYLVKHHFLGITLILKTLDTANLPDETILERFKREAKILARIKHTNIINVVDFGFAGHFFYISVEYFESENLREVLKKTVLTDEQKKHLVIQLLRGLEAAHKAQVIHRDIKPENILVNSKLELKIADFGLAFPENELMVTQKSSIVGTPSYMSPEQIMGEDLTVQSDLFSAGIVAYEICTKNNPFLKADINATINTILSFEPQQLSTWESVPVDLREHIQKMLQRSKTKRLSSCADFLSQFPETLPPVVDEQKFGMKNTRVLYAGVLLLFVAAVAMLVYSSMANQSGTPSITPPSVRQSQDSVPVTAQAPHENSNVNTTPTGAASEKEKTEAPVTNDAQMTETPQSGNYLVNLVVECSPWANVYVDSMKLDVTPVRQSVRLTGGKHIIRFIHPDYPQYTTSFQVVRDGLQSFKLNMDTLVAKISFQVFPWGEVYVDGKFFGVTPMKNAIQVSPGKHTVQFKNPGYGDFSENYTFRRGETRLIEFNFEKKQQKLN